MAKTLIWEIFQRFRGEISTNCRFFEKYISLKLKVIFSTNFRPKTQKIVRAVFEKNIKVFWANLKTFSRISPN